MSRCAQKTAGASVAQKIVSLSVALIYSETGQVSASRENFRDPEAEGEEHDTSWGNLGKKDGPEQSYDPQAANQRWLILYDGLGTRPGTAYNVVRHNSLDII